MVHTYAGIGLSENTWWACPSRDALMIAATGESDVFAWSREANELHMRYREELRQVFVKVQERDRRINDVCKQRDMLRKRCHKLQKRIAELEE